MDNIPNSLKLPAVMIYRVYKNSYFLEILKCYPFNDLFTLYLQFQRLKFYLPSL